MTSDQAIEIVQSIRVRGLFDNQLPISIRVLSVNSEQSINTLIWVAGTSGIFHTSIVDKGERELIQEIFNQCLQILSTELYARFNSPT